ncbi:MAG: transglycosylase family protein [Actinomycetota bacterium]|nr:transglycosylase family protein [Actinomycetota bacterium]
MRQKLRRGVIVRSLLAALVVVVVVMAINDSTRSTYRETSPPVGRAVAEAPLPDLSEAGFRLGGLAVSLVGSLFSGTRVAMDLEGSSATSTSLIAASSTTVVRESPVTTSTSIVVASTVATSLAPTTNAPTTVPNTEEPELESTEPNVDPMIFGQPYLNSWPTLDMWDRIAWCESRRTWDVDTGNGYFGGLQFALGSWQWVGGTGNPAHATKEEQIYRANLLWQAQGWNGWPGCKKYFGWMRWQIRQ